MSDQERNDRRRMGRLGWLALATALPLAGAAILWWIPGSREQTIWVSLVVIGLALAGWLYWREE